MPAQVSCPHCNYLMFEDGSLSGQNVACPNCNGQFIMPSVGVVYQNPYQPPRYYSRRQPDPIRSCAMQAMLWSFIFVPIGAVVGVASSQYFPAIGAFAQLAKPWSPYLKSLILPHVLLFGGVGLVLGILFGIMIFALGRK